MVGPRRGVEDHAPNLRWRGLRRPQLRHTQTTVVWGGAALVLYGLPIGRKAARGPFGIEDQAVAP